jgi:hypothetical protein
MNNVVTTVHPTGTPASVSTALENDSALPHASLAARLTLRLGLWLLLRSTAHLNRSPAARDAHRLGLCNERDRRAREHAAVALSALGSRVV